MPLGKSLGNILGDYFGEEALELNQSENIGLSQSLATYIPISEVQMSPFQTRTSFDFEKIQNLAENIKESGLIHPILVVVKESAKKDEKEYILVAGERRLRACKLLGWKEIMAIVRPANSLTQQQQAMLSALENLQREDLSAIELANTYKMLMQTQNIDEEQLAKTLGNSIQYIKNYLRLLTLSKPVQQALSSKAIGEGQARHLVGLSEEKQAEILEEIIKKDLTVKEIIALLDKPKRVFKDRDIKNLHNLNQEIVKRVDDIAKSFPKAKIKIEGDDKKGKIVISW